MSAPVTSNTVLIASMAKIGCPTGVVHDVTKSLADHALHEILLIWLRELALCCILAVMLPS